MAGRDAANGDAKALPAPPPPLRAAMSHILLRSACSEASDEREEDERLSPAGKPALR